MADFEQFAVNLVSIREAHARIAQHIHETPVLTSSTLNSLSGRNLYFKSEFMQKTGSFKARGACNAVFKNDYSAVVTHSSGNHGQALAWAAKMKGIPAHVVMPNNAPICKQLAVSGYNGIITFCEPNQAARENTSEEVMKETGAAFVHPYNNVDVMSGQGTIALELLSQIEHLDAIIVPIGGGGMCSGITIAAKSINPSIKIIAAEPAMANDAFRSKTAGTLTPNDSPPSTIADGLKTNLGK
jgi:threonine dehydratase